MLAITEGLADVHILGKEAAALHFSVMEDLSKVRPCNSVSVLLFRYTLLAVMNKR